MIALIISLLVPAIAGFINWYAHDTYSARYWFREAGVYSATGDFLNGLREKPSKKGFY